MLSNARFVLYINISHYRFVIMVVELHCSRAWTAFVQCVEKHNSLKCLQSDVWHSYCVPSIVLQCFVFHHLLNVKVETLLLRNIWMDEIAPINMHSLFVFKYFVLFVDVSLLSVNVQCPDVSVILYIAGILPVWKYVVGLQCATLVAPTCGH